MKRNKNNNKKIKKQTKTGWKRTCKEILHVTMCEHAYMHVCACVCMYIDMHAYACVWGVGWVYVYIYMYAYVCVCVCVLSLIHISEPTRRA